ncbi:kinase-like protein [Rhizophagus irregularis]|uniref:Kinase-like protein n=1 Tax=Rhizophagus irregularis TaxID=588596 RepID=A0A2N1MD14_9GLOM|nr:kinase-like protein [Rhizophagus irregularis]
MSDKCTIELKDKAKERYEIKRSFNYETFLGHQDYIQRHEEKGNIIKDIVSGLLELQKHNIVHTELSPGNIMFFQENNGCVESWKLIDFDTACFAGSYYAKIKMNYSAPEVIRAQEEGIEIKADFSMDMFSFGLVLYFIETGRHYWDGWDIENEEVKREIISGNKYSSLLQNIRDQNSCWIIKSLLVKDISHRMKLDRFMRTPYYTGESKSTNVKNFESDYEINEELFQLYQSKFTQKVIEEYHNEMKESLRRLNDKVDNCKKAVEDLTDLTRKIPQWLVKLQNEKVPRVFVMIPDQKDWKKPT